MNSKLLLIMLLDILKDAGIEVDTNAARRYIESIPSNLQMTEKAYAKWRKKQPNIEK